MRPSGPCRASPRGQAEGLRVPAPDLSRIVGTREDLTVLPDHLEHVEAEGRLHLGQERVELLARGLDELPRTELEQGAIDQVVVRTEARELPVLRGGASLEGVLDPRDGSLAQRCIGLFVRARELASCQVVRSGQGQETTGQHAQHEARAQLQGRPPRATYASPSSRRPVASKRTPPTPARRYSTGTARPSTTAVQRAQALEAAA